MISEKLIAQKLLQINAIKLNPQSPFTWASGIKSPIYCDNRITLSNPETRTLIKEGLKTIAEGIDGLNHISGVATAGIAHGALLADAMDLPFSYVRSSPKKHGRQNQIEGDIQEGSNILVVEDLISTGGSSIEAVEVLRSNGYNVLGVAAIFTYQFDKARENFEKAKCPFYTLSNYSTLISEALTSSYISEAEAETLQAWNTNPSSWYDTHYNK